MIENKIVDDSYLLVHPVRLRIIQALLQEPSYIAQIAEKINMIDRQRLVGFHLTLLAKHGWVIGNFALEETINTTPKAVKYYKLQPKVLATLHEFANQLLNLQMEYKLPREWRKEEKQI